MIPIVRLSLSLSPPYFRLFPSSEEVGARFFSANFLFFFSLHESKMKLFVLISVLIASIFAVCLKINLEVKYLMFVVNRHSCDCSRLSNLPHSLPIPCHPLGKFIDNWLLYRSCFFSGRGRLESRFGWQTAGIYHYKLSQLCVQIITDLLFERHRKVRSIRNGAIFNCQYMQNVVF